MDNEIQKATSSDHDQPPQDEVTRNKIDKHLSDINDTISEEDIKNINTSTGHEREVAKTHRPADEENEIEKKDKDDDDDETEMLQEFGITDVKSDVLPRGVIVGSVELHDSNEGEWHLRKPQRPRKQEQLEAS